MRSCAVIPARGGSVRIPRKNIKQFHGKPIIQYSIETAIESCLFDQVFVSTDDDEIASVSEKCGARIIKRDAHLSDSITGTQEVMKHALRHFPCEIACCIYATSPMMTTLDLIKGYQELLDHPNGYAFSVGDSPLSDAGMFYWGMRTSFMCDVPIVSDQSVMIKIPKERCIDINTLDDWAKAEQMYLSLRGEIEQPG